MIAMTLAALTIALPQASAPAVVDAAGSAIEPQETALVQTAKPLTAVQVYSEKPVCRSIVVTGTRFAHQECHTAFIWKQMDRDGSDYASYVQNHANSFCFNAALCSH